jgi:hypothetical protein
MAHIYVSTKMFFCEDLTKLNYNIYILLSTDFSVQAYSCKKVVYYESSRVIRPHSDTHIHIQLTGFSFPKIKINDNLKKLH